MLLTKIDMTKLPVAEIKIIFKLVEAESSLFLTLWQNDSSIIFGTFSLTDHHHVPTYVQSHVIICVF